MARVLTDRYVQALKPPPKGRVDYFDAKTPGLHLRLSATGHRTWRYYFRASGRQRRLSWSGILPLAEVRKLAAEAAGDRARGKDPAAAKHAERAAARAATSVAALVKRFLVEYVEKKQLRDAREIRRIFDKYVLPKWGTRKTKEITRADVQALLGPIAARAPVMSNRVRVRISKLFNWAMSVNVVDANPATKIDGEPEAERERELAPAEIRRLWPAFDTLGPVMSAFFKIRLLTAQRGGEVAGMRWDEIDEAGEWWTIPASRTKNKRAHRVYLSEPTRALLDALPRAGDYVFPGRKDGAPLVAYQKAWQTAKCHAAETNARAHEPDADAKRLEALVAADTLMTARTHDLRRTAASRMGELGVDEHIIGRILNHTAPGDRSAKVTRVYNRYRYDKEKAAALTKWGRQLEAILAGTKGAATVITLRVAAAAEAGR